MNKRIYSILSAVWLVTCCAYGVDASDDDSQADLRLNPDIEDTMVEAIDYSGYKFLNLTADTIELNGRDWSGLASRFKSAARGDSLFSVVYLGDSHIQADFGGSVLRERLINASRKAGRGIIIPFKLAATNQPVDYRFNTQAQFIASKLLKQPWATEMPFTGIGLQPVERQYSIDIHSEMAFSRMRFIYTGGVPGVSAVTADADSLAYALVDGGAGSELTIALDRSLCDAKVSFKGDKSTVFGGVELLSDTVGTVVHSIGNNGATYSSYALVEGVGSGLSQLNPDLVIIALGTNEAFGRTDAVSLHADMSTLIDAVRRHNPGTEIMLVGPAECYKKVTKRVRNKQGKLRRVSSQVVNTKVLTIRNAIRDFARQEGIAYYDHYEIARSTGGAAKMKKDGVLSKDGVHYTAQGYRLWGNLLADAILNQFMKSESIEKK